MAEWYNIEVRSSKLSPWGHASSTGNEDQATNQADRLAESGRYYRVRVTDKDGNVVYIAE